MTDTTRKTNTKKPKKHASRKRRRTKEEKFIMDDDNAPRHRPRLTRHHLAYECLESNHPELARELTRNLTARALRIMRTRPAPRIDAPRTNAPSAS